MSYVPNARGGLAFLDERRDSRVPIAAKTAKDRRRRENGARSGIGVSSLRPSCPNFIFLHVEFVSPLPLTARVFSFFPAKHRKIDRYVLNYLESFSTKFQREIQSQRVCTELAFYLVMYAPFVSANHPPFPARFPSIEYRRRVSLLLNFSSFFRPDEFQRIIFPKFRFIPKLLAPGLAEREMFCQDGNV